VRMRLGRWHLVRRAAAHAATSENVAPKMAKLAVDRERVSFPQWVVRPPHASAVKGTGGVWEVVEELRSELEVERVARRKQDEALRVLWSEASFFFCFCFCFLLLRLLLRKAHAG
jgi:hypothetical protein